MASDEEGHSSDERIEEYDELDSNMLVSKKKTTSFIWKYFRFETDRNGRPLRVDAPKYRLCQATVAAKDSNTFNLYSHLQNKHPEEFVIVQWASSSKKKNHHRSNQTSLLDSWSKQQPLSSSSKEHRVATN